ncbi:MAG: hypothetical protein HP023_06800 [Lachnospiraceae bacterium]|nr:hypothetical protein [Lachnospiraceae bacterium]
MKKIIKFYRQHGWKFALSAIVIISLGWLIEDLISATAGFILVGCGSAISIIILILCCIDVWRTWRGKL